MLFQVEALGKESDTNADEDVFDEIEIAEEEEEEITKELLDEIAPDPYYFTDDDPDDVPDHVKEYLGTDN